MSEWYQAHDSDIGLDEKQGEINVYVTQNESGSVYVTLSFDLIKRIYNQVKDKQLTPPHKD